MLSSNSVTTSATPWIQTLLATGLAGGAAWYLVEEHKHSRLQKEHHANYDELKELINFNFPLSSSTTSNASFQQSLRSVHRCTIPTNIPLSHPETQSELQFCRTDTNEFNGIEAVFKTRTQDNKSIEIELLLENVYLKETTAYTGRMYDLYQEKRTVASFSKDWAAALHIIHVSNYWYPEASFRVYLYYDFMWNEHDEELQTRYVQLETEKMPVQNVQQLSNASKLRKRVFQPMVMVQPASARLVETMLVIPTTATLTKANGLKLAVKTLHTLHADQTRYTVMYRLESEQQQKKEDPEGQHQQHHFLHHHIQPNEPFTVEFNSEPDSTNQAIIRVTLCVLEGGTVKLVSFC